MSEKDILKQEVFSDYKINLIPGTSYYLLQKRNNIIKNFFKINIDAILIISIFLLPAFYIPYFLFNGFSLELNGFNILIDGNRPGNFSINTIHGLIMFIIFIESYIIGCFIIIFAFNCNNEILYDEWDKKLIVNQCVYNIKEIIIYPLCPFGVTNSSFAIYSFKTIPDKTFNCFIPIINTKILNLLNTHNIRISFVIYILTTLIIIISLFFGVDYTFFADRFRSYP